LIYALLVSDGSSGMHSVFCSIGALVQGRQISFDRLTPLVFQLFLDMSSRRS